MFRILFLITTLLFLLVSCKVKIKDDGSGTGKVEIVDVVTDVLSDTNKDTSITKVVMLGSGNPNADPKCSGPCVAVVVRDTPYIVDCGPGLVRRASAAHAFLMALIP